MRVVFPTFNPPAPTPNRQLQTIPGMSGDWVDNNRTFASADVAVNAVIFMPQKYKSFFTLKGDIEHWLFNGGEDWLVFGRDPDYLYKAVITTAPVFTPVNFERINVTMNFHFQPFKWQEKTIHWSKLPPNGIAINDETENVRPDWHLNGTGSFMLTVNGFPYEFDNLDGDIYLIGDEDNAYSHDPEKINETNSLMNTHIRLANNTSPELLCSGDGRNSIEIKPLDDSSKLNLIEFKPKLRRLI